MALGLSCLMINIFIDSLKVPSDRDAAPFVCGGLCLAGAAAAAAAIATAGAIGTASLQSETPIKLNKNENTKKYFEGKEKTFGGR